MAPAEARFLSGSHAEGTQQRPYRLFVPPAAGALQPLLLMLHGTGADYQLVLNPDVDVASDALVNAIRWLDAHPEVGAAAPAAWCAMPSPSALPTGPSRRRRRPPCPQSGRCTPSMRSSSIASKRKISPHRRKQATQHFVAEFISI